VLLPETVADWLPEELDRLRRVFGIRAYCALTRKFLPDEAARLRSIRNAPAQARVPTAATKDVLYHAPSRRMLQHVVTCMVRNMKEKEAEQLVDRRTYDRIATGRSTKVFTTSKIRGPGPACRSRP
jgi:DNA polymerase III alpha subunit